VTTDTQVPRPAGGRPEWARRLTGIEGLRGLAALAVLVYHVQRNLNRSSADVWPLGEVSFLSHGLTLFFTLSGFLLFRPFVAALLDGREHFGTARYLLNRVIRIFPAYIVVLLFSSIVLQVAYLPRPVDGQSAEFGRLDAGDTLLNAVLLQGYFPRTVRSGLEVAWTLGVEVAFYVLMPLLAFGAAWLARRFVHPLVGSILPAAFFAVLGIAGKLWMLSSEVGMDGSEKLSFEWGANWTTVVARSILVHGDLFAYGMIAAIIFIYAESGRISLKRLNRWRWAAALVGVGALVLATTDMTGPFSSSLVAIASGAVLLLAATPRSAGHPGWAGRLFSSRGLGWFGLVSFSIYLWHLPVIRFMQVHELALPDTLPGFFGNLAIVFVVTIGLSALTYYFVEAQALKLKKRKAPSPKQPPSAADGETSGLGSADAGPR
jgi:peptidoglycan/LPS O-acetylase OafA/YrhL